MVDAKSDRFKYNMIFEIAMQNILGTHYSHSAELFREVDYSKKYLRRAIKKLRKRVVELITHDERLLTQCESILDSIDDLAKKTADDVNNDWEIIANLILLVSKLVGFDWCDGKIYHHAFFYQDLKQEFDSETQKRGARDVYKELMDVRKYQYMTVNSLNKKNLPMIQIGNILNISKDRVKQILEEIKVWERENDNDFPIIG